MQTWLTVSPVRITLREIMNCFGHSFFKECKIERIVKEDVTLFCNYSIIRKLPFCCLCIKIYTNYSRWNVYLRNPWVLVLVFFYFPGAVFRTINLSHVTFILYLIDWLKIIGWLYSQCESVDIVPSLSWNERKLTTLNLNLARITKKNLKRNFN